MSWIRLVLIPGAFLAAVRILLLPKSRAHYRAAQKEKQ